MTYVRLDDLIDQHPKIRALSAEAFRLYVYGLAYCGRMLTDGVITSPLPWPAKARHVHELEDHFLWEKTASGWVVHNYLRHQRSSEAAEKSRQSARERWAKTGAASREAKTKRDDASQESALSEVEGRGQRAEGRGTALQPTAAAVAGPPPLDAACGDRFGTIQMAVFAMSGPDADYARTLAETYTQAEIVKAIADARLVLRGAKLYVRHIAEHLPARGRPKLAPGRVDHDAQIAALIRETEEAKAG